MKKEMISKPNMSSDSKMTEPSPKEAAKYLGIKGNREPESKELGNPMKHAVTMVHRHNERGEHAPMVCGEKMEDREGR